MTKHKEGSKGLESAVWSIQGKNTDKMRQTGRFGESIEGKLTAILIIESRHSLSVNVV
jgi:hypothetical protein